MRSASLFAVAVLVVTLIAARPVFAATLLLDVSPSSTTLGQYITLFGAVTPPYTTEDTIVFTFYAGTGCAVKIGFTFNIRADSLGAYTYKLPMVRPLGFPPGSYSVKADDVSYPGGLWSDCRDFTVTGFSPTTTTTTIVDQNHVPIASPVVVGTVVRDTATVAGQGVPAAESLTYQFFATIDCTGPHTDEVVTLNSGTVPDSALHGPLEAGSYSFLAVYSGDANYLGSTSSCEPLTVGLPTPVGGVVVPANTFALVAPWLAVIGVVGCVAADAVVRKKRHP